MGSESHDARPDRLESLSLEFGYHDCLMRCPYCYCHGPPTEPQSFRTNREPLSVNELLGVVDDAMTMGLGGVGIIGPYEPLQEAGIVDLIVGLRSRKLRATIFTKGTCITEELAKSLSENDVTVGITVHSLRGDIHDQLVGRRGTSVKAMQGIDRLLKVGYEHKRNRIMVQSVVVRQNIDDLPEVWQWARRNGFVPFLERITVQGMARRNMSLLSVAPHELKLTWDSIARIDKEEFGRSWMPHPPWVGESCTRHLNGCHLTADGYVQPCTGVDIPVGNVRDSNLASILRNSGIIRSLRNIRQTIRGACKNCSLHQVCYGCRGQAYQLTGDFLASDPCCWRNPDACSSDCAVASACHRGWSANAGCGTEQVGPQGLSDRVASDPS